MRMYGDLVNGICYGAFVPFYIWLWSQDPSPSGRNVNLAFACTAGFSWASFLSNDPRYSLMASLGNALTIAGMNLYRWPHTEEVVVIPQFFWSLLIITGNLSLDFKYKIGMGLIGLSNALIVASRTPLLDLGENLPTLLGAFAVYAGFHFYTNDKNKNKRSIISAHGASLVLAGTFAYHMSSELIGIVNTPGYAKEGGYSILKAAFFALVGLAAAGAFRKEIDMKQTLEVLVRQRAEEIMKQADRLRVVEHALQASETAIAVIDSSQRILWSNKAMQKLIKLNEHDSQGKYLLDVLGITQRVKSSMISLFNTHNCTHDEFFVNGADLSMDISPFPEDKGFEHYGSRYLVVLKDITAQNARDRAEKAAAKEAMSAQAMQDSMQTLSHELRTPLQGIMGMTSIMLDESNLSDNVRESMTVVMTSARLLLTLINNMLDVRKCDSAMMDDFQLYPLRLSKALSNALDFCKPFAGIACVGLSLDLGNYTDVSVQSNDLRFQQVMINLISNAIKYSVVGSRVHVSVTVLSHKEAEQQAAKALASGSRKMAQDVQKLESDHAAVAVISVSDSGSGIPEGQSGLIFGKFSQLSTSDTNNKKNAPKIVQPGGGAAAGQPSGTGLGLNLCHKFVHRMKGNIWVNNNKDKGSSFSFYLPVALHNRITKPSSASQLGSVPAHPKEVEKGQQQGAGSFSISNYHVLVVDDTIINLKVLDRLLKRVGVGKVKCVSSGPKALEALEMEPFNLVLTDLQMPEMTGIELTRLILTKFPSRTPVVVGLTAEVSESADLRCQEAGMSTVLHKPITSSQMKEFFEDMAGQIPVSM